VVCLAVYLMVRAVGWVLAGFMARCDIHAVVRGGRLPSPLVKSGDHRNPHTTFQ
jgi:hypothetical protein